MCGLSAFPFSEGFSRWPLFFEVVFNSCFLCGHILVLLLSAYSIISNKKGLFQLFFWSFLAYLKDWFLRYNRHTFRIYF